MKTATNLPALADLNQNNLNADYSQKNDQNEMGVGGLAIKEFHFHREFE